MSDGNGSTTRTPLDAATLAGLRRFIGPAQMAAMLEGMQGVDRDFFLGKLVEMGERIAAMPATYATDGQGDEAIVHLHYFTGGCDWYITEKDCENAQHQTFGLACIHELELGYISIVELLRCRAELDLHFTPRTLASVKQERMTIG
jgi:hypothetical protein